MGKYPANTRATLRDGYGDILAWRGEMHLWAGRYRTALRDLETARQLHSTLSFCWLGGALVKLNKYRKAIALLDKALMLHPRDAEAYVWRAEARRRLRQHAGALQDAQRALDITEHIWGYFNRALIFGSLGRAGKMRNDFHHIMRSHPLVGRFILQEAKLSFPGTSAEIGEFLEKGLSLARGNRRHESYSIQIWMNIVGNARDKRRAAP